MSYFQISRKILDSSVWIGSDAETKILWIYLLMAADIKTGRVEKPIVGIAKGAEISKDRVREILNIFSLPDENSHFKEYGGRRIIYIDPENENAGIVILNYQKYKEEHFAISADRVRKHRAMKKACNVTVTKDKDKDKDKEGNPLMGELAR
jgi:hypothetical protein